MKKTNRKWLGMQFENTAVKSNAACTKTSPLRNSTNNLTKNNLRNTKKPNFNFYQHLTPKTVADLAVHTKKITEVECWLKSNVCDKSKDSTAKFLLITGPTGSGKTITVQVLCKSLDIEISEWSSPVDQDFETFRGPNQITRFTEFLTESKWNSLFSASTKKIILVEDFPNSLIRNPDDFSTVLENCYYKGNYPIVFICTDSFDIKINLAEKLFTQEIKDNYRITEISFNACAITLLKNALKRAHNLVQDNLDNFKTPTANTVNAILSSSMGDLKCAINQYYFACLMGTGDLPVVSEKYPQKTGTKRKRINKSVSVQLMSRDQQLGLFHGIGRVLNPKRVENGNSWRFHCDVDKLIDEFITQPSSFTNFLFENYVKYYGDIYDAEKAAEILSLSQTFLEKWIDRHDVLTYAMWVSAMGLMIHNEHKVSKWNQITGPKKIKRKSTMGAQGKEAEITDIFYINIINKNSNIKFEWNL